MKIYFAGSRLDSDHEKHISILSGRRLYTYAECLPSHMAYKSIMVVFSLIRERSGYEDIPRIHGSLE